MTHPMIEAAAKALFEKFQDRQEMTGFYTNGLLFGKAERVTWEFVTSPQIVSIIADQYRDEARAAIHSLREPTEDMAQAGGAIVYGSGKQSYEAVGALFGINGSAAFMAVKRVRERIQSALEAASPIYIGQPLPPSRLHPSWIEFSL